MATTPPRPDPPAAILFDLFHTLIVPRPGGLPLVRVAPDKSVPSTAPMLVDVIRAWRPGLTVEELMPVLWEGWQRAETVRRQEHREIHAVERFGWVLDAVDAAGVDAAERGRRAEAVLAAHRGALVGAMEFPPAHAELLADLAARLPVGVITNYDDPDGAVAVFERAGVAAHLAVLVVSGAEGVVKPHPGLFRTAAAGLGLPAGELLYVGDNWESDVVGARQAGLRAAWYTGSAGGPGAPTRRADAPIPPDYGDDPHIHRIDDLNQLEEWIL